MKITEEMIAEDEKRWGLRDVVMELGYCGNNMCNSNSMTNLDIRFYAYIMRKAHEMLKAQEPRVMTQEEVADWHKKQALEREPIYVEYRPNSCLGISQWTIDYFGFNPNYYPNKEFGLYGRWIRCWTSRPTLEQMEMTPWQ